MVSSLKGLLFSQEEWSVGGSEGEGRWEGERGGGKRGNTVVRMYCMGKEFFSIKRENMSNKWNEETSRFM